MPDVRTKAQAAVAALFDLAAELDSEGGERAEKNATRIRTMAEYLEYRYCPDFHDDEEAKPHATD